MTMPAGFFRIGKSFRFDASHQLHGLPDDHKCGRLHGHTYTVEVTLAGSELSGPGFVTDFGDLAPLKRYIDSTFDHRHLNDVLDVEPTAEHLARHLGVWCLERLGPLVPGLIASVRVQETPTSWAEWTVGS